ncbi:MAG TPA: hypothetical protein PKV73_00980 [Agriterribacter sp.]|nr:hypothetical protein [Agriterribacter sp.]
MTETMVLYWIRDNLGEIIRKALSEKEVIYTEDWLAGMAYRETGFLINRYASQKLKPEIIFSLMKGDYGQRLKDKEKIYHGFGVWQIDIDSYPDFVKSGDWKDPYKTVKKAIDVLEEKRIYLSKHLDFGKMELQQIHMAITAAYNCGQGNVVKAINKKLDVDRYTHNGDYSKMVWEYREAYRNLKNHNKPNND